jgi:hypothetical protein
MTRWRESGKTAVITGGASGIGLAAAAQFVRDGMNVLIADVNADALEKARVSLEAAAAGRSKVVAQACDVTDLAQLRALRDTAFGTLGAVHCLMNNAGVGIRVGPPWENLDELRKTLDINLFGVVHGCQAFIPAMLEAKSPGVVINTGSKQGITRPPGNYAYNLSKAAVLAYTESIAHTFAVTEGCQLTAHLLVPGFVYTAMVQRFVPEQPASAWTAEQTIDFMLPCVERGDFYILCPDNETTREIDEMRIQWTADDLIKNRPALSRWHPDYKAEFAAYMKRGKG